MNERNYPANILAQTKALSAALKNIDPSFRVGELTHTSLDTDLENITAILSIINNLEIQLTDQRNKRDALYGEVWQKVKRLRAGVKGMYGDDSSQYEMAGGTRLSERKPRARKKAMVSSQT